MSGEASPALALRTISAAQWRLASSLIQGGLQFAIGILLARLLPPEDFGVLALALVVIGLAMMISDAGFGAAVVQRRPLTPAHVRVAFTASTLLGIALCLGVYAVAPFAGTLLRSDALPPVLRVQGILFTLLGLGTVARALLHRSLAFRALFRIDLASYLAGYGMVAVPAAWMGWGVWSLVLGALVQGGLSSALALARVRHSPIPLLAKRELQELFHFGAGVSLNNVVNYLARNGDNFIVGRWLGTAALGLYGRAFQLMTLPVTYLSGVIYGVLFPALSEVQNDPARVGRAYLMGVQVTALVAGPVMAGMIVAAPHMIVGLYGPEWAGAVLPLQILCGAGFFRAIYHLTGAVTHATGKVYEELKRQGIYAVLVVVGGFAGTFWGISAVAAFISLAIVCMYFIMAELTLRLVGSGWREFWIAQLPGVLLGLHTAVVALLVRTLLEHQGVASLWIFAAILMACAASLPVGIYLLPGRLRPEALFDRIGRSAARWPPPLRLTLNRVLRISW